MSLSPTVTSIFRYERLGGFYKGLGAYLIHVTPNICIVFLIYEKLSPSTVLLKSARTYAEDWHCRLSLGLQIVWSLSNVSNVLSFWLSFWSSLTINFRFDIISNDSPIYSDFQLFINCSNEMVFNWSLKINLILLLTKHLTTFRSINIFE